MQTIKIIGAGLAGCEGALQLAKRGYNVKIFEMRPMKQTEAHKTPLFAEIVCSNSFKSNFITTGAGLLKAELEMLDCELLKIAKKCKIPSGGALAVDRKKFATLVTQTIKQNPNIQVIHCEVKNLNWQEPTILATGPLTSISLLNFLAKKLKQENLYFFDAIAPIIDSDSIDMKKVFRKSRYDKSDADYLNCPFTKDEYFNFVQALKNGKKYQTKDFETEFFKITKFKFYENCIPIEELARRGVDTLRFGVLKPVGLEQDGKRAYAVLQLRTENKNFTSFNLVGCQTMLRQSEQKDIFQKVPGLKNCKFLRYGSIHKNSFINSPKILNKDLSLKTIPNIYPAGQLVGVEGYTESIWSGLITSKSINKESLNFPKETISAGLLSHLTSPNKNFQPMNANFGLLPPLKKKVRDKKEKKEQLSNLAVIKMKKFYNEN